MIYNSLGRVWGGYVRVPVKTPAITVTDPHGTCVPNEACTAVICFKYAIHYTQIFPVTDATKAVRGPKRNAPYDAVIKIDNVPPLGYSVYTASMCGITIIMTMLL